MGTGSSVVELKTVFGSMQAELAAKDLPLLENFGTKEQYLELTR